MKIVKVELNVIMSTDERFHQYIKIGYLHLVES